MDVRKHDKHVNPYACEEGAKQILTLDVIQLMILTLDVIQLMILTLEVRERTGKHVRHRILRTLFMASRDKGLRSSSSSMRIMIVLVMMRLTKTNDDDDDGWVVMTEWI